MNVSFQTRCNSNRNGCSPTGLSEGGSTPLLYPRRRLLRSCWTGWVSPHTGQKRYSLQFIFPVEEFGWIHQHALLVQTLCTAPCACGTEGLHRHPDLVGWQRNLHKWWVEKKHCNYYWATSWKLIKSSSVRFFFFVMIEISSILCAKKRNNNLPERLNISKSGAINLSD